MIQDFARVLRSKLREDMNNYTDDMAAGACQTFEQYQKLCGVIQLSLIHISEHVAYAYRQKIEQQLGMALPPEEEKLPPQVELALSSMMAQAAQQVLQENQAKAAQQQAQQQAQDPVLQMQAQELQIKQQELALKEKKIAADAATKADELALREKQIAADAAFKADKLEADQERDGVRMGIEIAKSRQQAAGRQQTKGKPSNQ